MAAHGNLDVPAPRALADQQIIACPDFAMHAHWCMRHKSRQLLEPFDTVCDNADIAVAFLGGQG